MSIFAFIFMRMKIQLFILNIFVLMLVASCENRRSREFEEQVLGTLKENQAKVFLEIDGKPFYSNESSFSGNVHLGKERMSLNISDQFEGQVMLGFASPSWYKRFPVKYEISEAERNDSRVMIGKIVDAKKRIGEGYLLHDGTIEITQLTPDKLIMKINGKCGRYDGFELGKNLLEVNGSIIFKKPNVLFLDMNWEDLQ